MPRKINFDTDKVVIYARVSTSEQGDSKLGLEAQIKECQRYADIAEKEVVGIFQEVISGKAKLNERTEFGYALLTAQKHGATLVVAKLDRLTRVLDDFSGYLSRRIFGDATPPLVIAERPTATEFELNLYATLAQEERRLISRRTKAALAVKKSQGIELGKAGRESAHTKARQSTEEAIARAKELLASNMGFTDIAAKLNAEGFTTSRGSAWTKQSLYKRMSA